MVFLFSTIAYLLGYQVLDLTGATAQRFGLEANAWNATNLVTINKTSKCSLYPLLGGFEVMATQGYFERNYSLLPPHSAVYFQFRFFIIDINNWQEYDNFEIELEETIIIGQGLRSSSIVATSNICGLSMANDLQFYTILGKLPHNRNTFSVKILSNVSQSPSVASFGIRDISIVFVNNTNISATESCFRASNNNALGLPNECKCKRGEYQNPSNPSQCLPCDASCADCFGPSASECYVCNAGYSFTGNECIKCHTTCKTCSGPNKTQCITCDNNFWLQPDGNCKGSCIYPVQFQEQVDDFKLCKSPCQPNEYLFWNYTCNATCPTPFIQQVINGVNNCINPCQSNISQFLFWNGSCLNNCDYPFQPDMLNSVKLCNLPCTNSTPFLFSNDSSCQADCSYPLVQRVEGDVKFCDLPCQSWEYLFLNNSCATSCNSPYQQNILKNISLCNPPCINSTLFFFADGSCLPDCSFPLVQRIEGDVNFCDLPCQSGKYLFSNNSCSTSCNSPYQQSTFKNVNLCNPPCADTSVFYFQNGSCQADCSDPLIRRIEEGVNFCDLPCQLGEYLFLNNSCITSCNSPYQQSTLENVSVCNPPCTNSTLFFFADGSCQPDCSYPLIQRIHLGVKFCDLPCQTGEYLFLNNSCITTCDSPYVKVLENNINMCKSPCSQEYEYFYQKENTCKASCDSPNILSQTEYIKICDEYLGEVLTKTEIENIQQIATVTNVAGQSTSIGIIVTNIASSGNPQGISLASLVKMLQYIRYMEINYPPDVELMLKNQDPSSISLNFGIDLPRVLEDQIPKYPLPAKFDQYGLYSSFILNFWEEMCTILIVAFIIIICLIFVPVTKRFRYLHLFLARVLAITRWDFLILVISTNFDGIAMFASLELRTIHLDSFLTALSFLICICMNVVGLFLLGLIFYVVRDIQKAKKKVFVDLRSRPEEQDHLVEQKPYSEKWKYCKIVFSNFVNTSFIQQGYMFFFLLRIYLFNLTIGYLFEYPVLQASIITILSISIIVYVLHQRPLKRKFDMVQFLVDETIILIVNINVLILSILDACDAEAKDSRRSIGRVIVILNLAFSIIVLVFLAIEIIIKLFRIYKLVRSSKASGIVSQIQELFLAFFEQDGLALDEKEIHKASIVPLTDRNQSLTSIRASSEFTSLQRIQNKSDPGLLIPTKAESEIYEKKDASDASSNWPLKSYDLSPFKLSRFNTSNSPFSNRLKKPSIHIDDKNTTPEDDLESKDIQNGLTMSFSTIKETDANGQKTPISLPKCKIIYESPVYDTEEYLKGNYTPDDTKTPVSSQKRSHNLINIISKQIKDDIIQLNRKESLMSSSRTVPIGEETEAFKSE